MDNLNILIVEDESLVALELANTIRSFGYNVVEYATNPAMAREFVQKDDINLILMDINLGDEIDGIDLYKSLDSDIPIAYLTAYKDEKTISKAVLTNPIGYLIKPHNEDELKALLKLAYYKIKNNYVAVQKDELLDIGEGYLFNTTENRLFYNDLYISLTAKELQLLKLLIDAKGSAVSYKSIEDEIWAEKTVSDSSIRTLIYRLRGKLEYKLIENEFNFGIKL